MSLCSFGCGRDAIHQFGNGKWCCCLDFRSCPGVIRKRVKKITGRTKETHKYLRRISEKISLRIKRNKYAKLTCEKFLERYPWFSKFEEIKEEDRKILVKCKICKNWFEPSTPQIYYRARSLQVEGRKYGNFYLYCSDTCKENCPQYHRQKDPETLSRYMRYRQDIERETYNSFKLYKNKIPNASLRSKINNLDHKFSIFQGFKNKIHPKIISHWKNLEVIPEPSNKSKRGNCSISLKKLIKEIKSVESDGFLKGYLKTKKSR